MQILFSGAIPTRRQGLGVTATLGILDVESGTVVHQCEYRTPSQLQAPEQKMQFTGYCFIDNRIYVCSHNEIVWFEDWPPIAPAGRISIPGFNDLHHCLAWDGGLAVANTGLETVDHVSLDGELIHRWDLLGELPNSRRINPEFDYRLIADTKPHLVHGNHLFTREGGLWVTQLRTSRAVPVSDPGEQIMFEAGMPHDGRPKNGLLAFTTTNGFVVVIDAESSQVLASHDLNQMTPGLEQLGWCRGLSHDPRDPNRFFVAFSVPRDSRWKDYARWIRDGAARPPTRIALYDIARGELLETNKILPEWDLLIFQLDALPPRLWI